MATDIGLSGALMNQVPSLSGFEITDQSQLGGPISGCRGSARSCQSVEDRHTSRARKTAASDRAVHGQRPTSSAQRIRPVDLGAPVAVRAIAAFFQIG